MIRSAVLKLTFAYLVIIMALSIAFSVTLYRISDSELNHGLRQPGTPVFRETSLYNFDTFRETRLSESRENLKANLVLLNLITLGAGFAASYLLARKTLEPIERAMKSQMQFTADASHELRTPLTAMQTEIEVALRDKNLSTDEAKELLASNLEEVGKLRQLSDDLLQLAHQNGEKLTNAMGNVRLSVASAVEYVAKPAAAKHIQLQIDGLDKDMLFKGDEASLSKLVAILLDNAIKYSPEKTTVTIKAKQDGSSILLRVTDQGVGIDKVDLPHIFDRFYRADISRTKIDAGGYGLGLSIAQKLAHLHDGSLEVEKTSKKGTTFLLKLHKA